MVPEIVIVRLVMQESIVRFLNWIPELIVQMDIIHRKEKWNNAYHVLRVIAVIQPEPRAHRVLMESIQSKQIQNVIHVLMAFIVLIHRVVKIMLNVHLELIHRMESVNPVRAMIIALRE